jgi:[ribosomal protein S5]-alanine N-acetyltransferase
MITTARMRLVPATVDLARAELTDQAEFARMLAADIADEWPPAILADVRPLFLQWMEAAPEQVGWYVWYAMMRTPRGASDLLAGGASDLLVASIGFKGPPQDGTVEIGYSVLPRFQGQGYATEMVRALTDWAFGQPGVRCIVAETAVDNIPSQRLLQRVGFTRGGEAVEPGHRRFVRDGHGAMKAP